MKINRKRTMKWISMVFLIIVFLVFTIPIPINKVYDAIEIKLDVPSYFVQCQVKSYGKYHWNLFSDDMFDGQIVVSNYKLTTEKMSKVYFSDDGWPLEYNYIAGYDTDGRPSWDTFFLGRLYSKSWFQQMTITVFSGNQANKTGGEKTKMSRGSWSERDGYCIVPLAASREKALDLLLENGIVQNLKR